MLIPVILILSVILDFHSTNASDCIYLWPYDPQAIDGEPFHMWCSVLPGCSLTSSDLFFSFDGVDPVDPLLVTVLNSTAILLTFPRIPVSLNQEDIFCVQRSSGNNGSSDFDSQRLSVGYRPFMPVISKDYKVFNWEYFEFHWTINNTDPVYHTPYKAWFRRTFDSDFIQCGEERKISRLRGRACRILDAMEFIHPNGILFFKVNGSNAVGSVSTDVERAVLYHIVQPGQVKNMTVVSSVETGVNVTFYAPKKEKRLKYNISVHCGSTSWSVNASKEKSPNWMKLNLPFPPFTNCSLSISCLPFYNRQYWSEPSEDVVFTSPDAVPLMSPDICCISIEQSTSEFRHVTVYFQKLKNEEARGKVTKYHYNLTSSRSDRRLPYSTEKQLPPNVTSLLLELYRDTESVVNLTAETRAGLNRSIASRFSIPSEEDLLRHPTNATVIWHGSGMMRISWSKVNNCFNSIVVWCQSTTTPCKSSVNWKKTESTFHDVYLPQKDLHRFGIATLSSDGNEISAIEWIKCIYDIDKDASVPRVIFINKTSSSICLGVKPADCANGDQGYIYEYQIQYTDGEKTVNVIKSASECDVNGECQFQFPNLTPESNYTFSVVAMTAKGPSIEVVLFESTDSTGALKLKHWIWIIIGSIVGFVFILLGIYKCCKWNKQLVTRVRKWFRINITVPDKQMVNERGIADGNVLLSSSYTSLSKQDTSVPLQSQNCDSNQSGVKSEERPVLETAFLVQPNDKNSTETENSSDIKSSNAVKKAKPVKSSSHPSSFQKGSTSNPGSSGSPPKSSSAGHVNQSTSAASRVEFVDESGTQQRNPDENANQNRPRQSTSRDFGISGRFQEDVESGTLSPALAEQSDALHRNNATDDPINRNNSSTDDNEGELEIGDYSNVRVSSDGCDEIQTIPDSYSLARLPSGDDDDNDSNGRDYSTALLMDDNHLGVSDEPPGHLDGNFSGEEDDHHDNVNYSTASMIRKSNC